MSEKSDNFSKSEIEKSVADIFASFSAGIKAQENDALALLLTTEAAQSAAASIARNDPQEFGRTLPTILDKAIGGALNAHGVQDHRAKFLFRNYDFIARHVKSAFSHFEGPVCCADKTGSVMQKLSGFLLSGEPIVFDYGAEYTFHLPDWIMKDQDSILRYFNAVYQMYYGRPLEYLRSFVEFHQMIPDSSRKGFDPEAEKSVQNKYSYVQSWDKMLPQETSGPSL